MLKVRNSAGVGKVEFSDVLRASLSEKVISEVIRLIDAFRESTERTIFENAPGEPIETVLQRNAQQFKEAVDTAITAWVETRRPRSRRR